MAEKKNTIGSINWVDLTVNDAGEIRDFYREVVGWNISEVKVGGYSDYCMNEPENGTTVAGICHARGENAHLPAQWLVYINVEDIDRSIARCTMRGGKVIAPLRVMGDQGRYCVIQDPAGAVAALFEPTK